MKLATLQAALLGALLSSNAAPAVVDRVAVTVGNRAITESRVVEEVRLSAFLNAEKPTFDATSRRAAANRLVERVLLGREIDITGYAAPPSDSATELLADIRGRYIDEPTFQTALTEAKLTETKVAANAAEQGRLLQFIDFRFRPGVTVTEADAHAFYETEYPAFWLALHPNQPQPGFDEARDDVERLLVDRKVDAEMDEWLKTARGQVRIVYRDEVFKDTAAPREGDQQREASK